MPRKSISNRYAKKFKQLLNDVPMKSAKFIEINGITQQLLWYSYRFQEKQQTDAPDQIYMEGTIHVALPSSDKNEFLSMMIGRKDPKFGDYDPTTIKGRIWHSENECMFREL